MAGPVVLTTIGPSRVRGGTRVGLEIIDKLASALEVEPAEFLRLRPTRRSHVPATAEDRAALSALLSEQQKATPTAWENARPGSRSWRPTQTGYKGN
jgi:hypothetical protein